MSITGISFSFRPRRRASDGLSGQSSHSKIPSRGPDLNCSLSVNDGLREFPTNEPSTLKRPLPKRARPQLGHPSFAFEDTQHKSGAHAKRAHQRKTYAQDSRHRETPPRADPEIQAINRTTRLGGAGDSEKQQSPVKPAVLVIHPRTFFRDCFVRCLETSYENHEILAFSSISAWRSASKQDASTLSVIVFFADGNNEAGFSDLQFLETAAAETPVVIMSDIDDASYVARALKGGARGYIPTSLPFNVAVEAVRLVEAGGTFVPVSSLELDHNTHEAAPKTNDVLTERQMMVVEALCQGMANKQIAYELGMSEHTVKVHLRHIMRKLKVRNRTEVAVLTKDLFERTNEQKWPDSAHRDILSRDKAIDGRC
jgi:DNA-binding NarL/FixJ family response regulator